MKTLLSIILSLSLLISIALPSSSLAEETATTHDFLALMTFGGTQSGGDEAAFIDTEGGCYYIDLEAEGLYLNGGEVIAKLRSLPDSYKIGELSADKLGDINTLINAIESTDVVVYGISACDAGVFRQEVFRARKETTDGSDVIGNSDDADTGVAATDSAVTTPKERITLLTAGDTVSENMDVHAIELSVILLNSMKSTRHLGRWSHLFPYSDSVPLTITFEHGSFVGGSISYSLQRYGDHVSFTAKGMNGNETDIDTVIDDSEGFFQENGMMAQLQALIDEYQISAWDGFEKKDADVLDGDGFTLTIDYGTLSINATGYMEYPGNYQAACDALDAFFCKLIEQHG